MYSWYMPKDQTIDEVSPGSHRHDFENVVIWLSGDLATVLGGAASGHGDYKKTTGALPGGDSATVEYFASFPTNHELQFTDTVGNTYPISDWDAMPDAAKSALQDTDFGDATPPFKVSHCSSLCLHSLFLVFQIMTSVVRSRNLSLLRGQPFVVVNFGSLCCPRLRAVMCCTCKTSPPSSLALLSRTHLCPGTSHELCAKHSAN